MYNLIEMKIRNAIRGDLPKIFSLAEKFDLDHRNMQTKNFLIAEEKEKIMGIVQLRKFKSGYELCSLGVEKKHQKQGIGSKLVKALLKGVKGKIYLATIKPKYFSKLGFVKTEDFPRFMIKKSEWCEGCCPSKCNIMVKEN